MTFQKRAASFALAATILWAPAAHSLAAAADPFQDVSASSGSHKEIHYLLGKGVIEAPKDRKFRPNAPVTRADAARMLVLATGNKPAAAPTTRFADVKDREASRYIGRAVDLGFFAGYPNGKFGAADSLTRGQMSAILAKAFRLDVEKWNKSPNVFADVKPNNLYLPSIKALYYSGIAAGDGGRFKTGDPVKRSQYALFLARAMDEQFRPQPIADDVAGESNAPGSYIGMGVGTGVDGTVYDAPKLTATAVDFLSDGSYVKVLSEKNGWYELDLKSFKGYVQKNALTIVEPAKPGKEPVPKPAPKPEPAAEFGDVLYERAVTAPELNIRSKPDASGALLGVLLKGEVFAVYGQKGSWLLLNANGKPGYVHKNYVAPVGTAPLPAPQPPKAPEIDPPIEEHVPPVQQNYGDLAGRVTVNSTNVRAAASASSAAIGSLKRGDTVAVKSLTGFWAEIKFKGGKGYVHKTYLKLINQGKQPLKNRILLIDPGHGGKDSGAVKYGVREKDLTLAVGLKVRDRLQKEGAVVIMSRTGDTYPSLPDRVKMAANSYSELFVSIHINSASSASAKGFESFYNNSRNQNAAESRALASAIHKEIVSDLKLVDRRVKDNVLYVNRMTNVPSTLLELGFITNQDDLAKMTNPALQDRYADAIVRGLKVYYSQ